VSISVIVPAPRLNAFAERCLAQLLALPQPVEILFVPDEPANVPEGVICIPSGAVTVGKKRQLALERATGEIVALIDDDAFPHPSWLANAVAALDADASIGAVCGPTLTPPDDSLLERLSGRVYASFAFSGPVRWRYAIVDARDVDDAPSVNLVLRREDALAAGMATGYRYGEDTILCESLRRRGRRIRYVPGAIVYHSRRPLWRPHMRQLWRWARRRGTFARRYRGNSLRASYFGPTALLLALALGWLLPGSWRLLWWALLVAYVAMVVVAGRSRRPSEWARVSVAIALSHLLYGAGFLLGALGLPLPEERDAQKVLESPVDAADNGGRQRPPTGVQRNEGV
jgi:cellulose synthase/poly-beta-1,6-N-acetylglucosamine synthase-like glycosyltransferase